MSRIHEVIRRYDALRSVSKNGVSLFAVGDPAGAQLNAAVRKIRNFIGDDESSPWDEVLRAATFLRWRRITQPQPNVYNSVVGELSQIVSQQVESLRGLVEGDALLDQLGDALVAVATLDSPVGTELLTSVLDVGPERCVVIASGAAARFGLLAWLGEYGVRVIVPSQYDQLNDSTDLSFIVGPPTVLPRGLFPQGLTTAPTTSELTFVMPAWFDRTLLDRVEYVLPRSEFSEHATGAVSIRAKVFQIGNFAEPDLSAPEQTHVEDDFYPQPIWGDRTSGEREPEPGETEAWKVLLAGGLALWLDDGERIRSLDPNQPAGARVGYESVDHVAQGTFLVLRDGATLRRAMYDAALEATKENAERIEATQRAWKQALSVRLANHGLSDVISELRNRGLRSAGRVSAWTEPTLISPRRTEDFIQLLGWLGIGEQPTRSYAASLRRALYRASAELGRELEEAVGHADLRDLERDGIMHLDLDRDGMRGLIVVRVLARSPFTQIVPRQQARIPFEDGGGKWLE